MAKILIIDDDPDIRTVLNILLKKQGHEVDTASREHEVQDKVTEFQPDIILLDVLLSGADGRAICQKIKTSKDTSHITVIMFSGHPGAAGKIDAYGADDFISKPVNTDALISKIQSHLNLLN
jgi:DNA-binding response OmpR family regulator